MDKDLIAALEHLSELKKLLRPHFSKFHWPVFYEDIDYISQAIKDIQDSLAKGEHLPF